jgi:hypothetical protein
MLSVAPWYAGRNLLGRSVAEIEALKQEEVC